MLFATDTTTTQLGPVESFFAQYGMLLILLALIVFMFWSSRRRAKKMKAEQEAKAVAMVPGVKVLLQGGLYGVLTEFDGEDLSKSARVEIAPGVEIEVHSQAVLRVVEPEEPAVTEDAYLEAEEHADEYAADVESGIVSSVSDDAAAPKPVDPDDKPQA